MVRIFVTASLAATLFVSPIAAAPINYARTVSSGLSSSLQSIGGRLTSDWRSNSIQTAVVQTVVESVAVESLSQFSDFSSFESNDQILEEIISALSSTGLSSLSLSNQDISNLVPSVFESFDENDIVLEMLDQVIQIILAGVVSPPTEIVLNSPSNLDISSISSSISNNFNSVAGLVGTSWRSNSLQTGLVQSLIRAQSLQSLQSSNSFSFSNLDVNSVISSLGSQSIVINEQDIQSLISTEDISNVEFAITMLEEVLQLPGFAFA